MSRLESYALQLLRNNPRIANNPQAQEMINVIQNGDNKRGEQIAMNICSSMGVNPQEAVQRAQSFFNIH